MQSCGDSRSACNSVQSVLGWTENAALWRSAVGGELAFSATSAALALASGGTQLMITVGMQSHCHHLHVWCPFVDFNAVTPAAVGAVADPTASVLP